MFLNYEKLELVRRVVEALRRGGGRGALAIPHPELLELTLLYTVSSAWFARIHPRACTDERDRARALGKHISDRARSKRGLGQAGCCWAWESFWAG